MLGKSKKVGLALGGGAAWGLAHIGVLAVLEREGIPVDMIAGTSAGALVGALFALGKSAGEIKQLALDVTLRKMARLVDPALPRSGLIKGERVKALLASFVGGNISFARLKIPLACVATDVDTGEEVVIMRGPVLEAVRASISIPAIFSVVKKGNRYLVDGGLINPVPVSVVRRMGADFVIAVNVLSDILNKAHRLDKDGKIDRKEPGILQVALHTMYISTYMLAKASLEQADAVIEPHVGTIGLGDFHRAEEGIRQGELAAEKAIPEIKKKLSVFS